MRLIQLVCAMCGSNLAVLIPSVYSAALRGGCCFQPCAADVVLGLRGFEINEDDDYYYYHRTCECCYWR